MGGRLMAVNLNREQRDTLRFAALLDLSDVGSISRLLEKGKAAEAERRRSRFEEDMRLLDDLGWEELDDRRRFPLTMPEEQLEAVLRRLLGPAEEGLDCLGRELKVGRHPWQTADDYQHSTAAIRNEIDEELDVRSACVSTLEALGAR